MMYLISISWKTWEVIEPIIKDILKLSLWLTFKISNYYHYFSLIGNLFILWFVFLFNFIHFSVNVKQEISNNSDNHLKNIFWIYCWFFNWSHFLNYFQNEIHYMINNDTDVIFSITLFWPVAEKTIYITMKICSSQDLSIFCLLFFLHV